jgi:hypothetical protein
LKVDFDERWSDLVVDEEFTKGRPTTVDFERGVWLTATSPSPTMQPSVELSLLGAVSVISSDWYKETILRIASISGGTVYRQFDFEYNFPKLYHRKPL